MDPTALVRESTARVVQQAKHVRIDHDAVARLAAKLVARRFCIVFASCNALFRWAVCTIVVSSQHCATDPMQHNADANCALGEAQSADVAYSISRVRFVCAGRQIGKR